MAADVYKYIWRCAKCYCHFANINQINGVLKLEKKCPKCKALNELTLSGQEIHIICKFFDQNGNGCDSAVEENYSYLGMEGNRRIDSGTF